MSFGTHTNLVQEVLDFAKSGNLLKPLGHTVQDSRCVVVASLDEAKACAWESVYGTQEFLWTDIREKAVSDLKATTYSGFESGVARFDFAKLLPILTKHVKMQLDEKHRDLLDDIVADLFNSACNRALHGSDDHFFEHVFSIYRFGGWPCGWQGDYPDGRFLTYFPSSLI